jgi:hypothetical protein
MDAFRNAGNFGIRWRPNSPEYRISLAVVDIDSGSRQGNYRS